MNSLSTFAISRTLLAPTFKKTVRLTPLAPAEEKVKKVVSPFLNSFHNLPPPPVLELSENDLPDIPDVLPKPPENVETSRRKTQTPPIDNYPEPIEEKGNILTYYSSPCPKRLFVSFSNKGAESVRNAIHANASCGESPEKSKVISLSSESSVKNCLLNPELETIVLMLDNQAIDLKSNPIIEEAISFFLEAGLQLMVATPRMPDIYSWDQLQKKASKCGHTLRKAIPIYQADEICSPFEPLVNKLQKVTEERERKETGGKKKETIQSRIKSASASYESGKKIDETSIVTANLSLRGIDLSPPPSFRAALLTHPDGPEGENKKILDSKEKREPILESLRSHSSIEGMVAFFREKYWSITKDFRIPFSANDFFAQVTLENCGETVSIGISCLDGKEEISTKDPVIICHFKLETRLVPFFNEKGEFTGMERAFLGPDAKKPIIGKRKTKLGRGVLLGSAASLYGSSSPTIKVIGEGVENVLVALQGALASPTLANSLGLNLKGRESNCQFSATLGVSDLIKIPIENSVETVFFVLDIDGYNLETRYSILDFFDEVLRRGISLKVLYPQGVPLGSKRDLNDVLMQEGIEGVKQALKNPIEILSTQELKKGNFPLQIHLELSRLNEEKDTPEVLFQKGKLLAKLQNYPEAFLSMKKASEKGNDELKGKAYLAIGNICLEKGWVDQAQRAFEKSLKLNLLKGLPVDQIIEAYEGMGRSQLIAGNLEEAEAIFTKIFYEKLKSNSEDHHLSIGSIFYYFAEIDFQKKNFSRALFYYQKAMKIFQREKEGETQFKVTDILEKIGDIYAEKDKHSKALEHYLAAHELLLRIFLSDRYIQNTGLLQKISDQYLYEDNLYKSLEYSKLALSDNPPSSLRNLLSRARTLHKKAPPELLSKIQFKRAVYEYQHLPSLDLKNLNIHTFNVLRERQKLRRQVAIDLEFTGVNPIQDRITEIGCVSLQNFKRTEKPFQEYINPERSVRKEPFRITGLTRNFLSDFSPISEVFPAFLDYIRGADLIFHGSDLDLQFLNEELRRANIEYDFKNSHTIIDTSILSNLYFPEKKMSLDSLNGAFKLNHSRQKHRALLDAEITADVYLSMISLDFF